jgi:hypothetical protein
MNPGNSTKQPTLRELVMQQTRINEDINKRLAINDNIFKDIHGKLEIFSSVVEKQHKIEDKLAQLATALPVATNLEQVSAITTRGGKSTRDPPYPKGTRRAPAVPAMAEEENHNQVEELFQEPQEREMRQDFHDTNYLPFPQRNKRLQSDE